MKAQPIVNMSIVVLLSSMDLAYCQKMYLSPAVNYNNSGSIEKPLAKLTAARNRAREYPKNNKVYQPIEIIALDGSEDWKKYAEFEHDLEKEFNKMVARSKSLK
jgi:hypothetical protein